MGTKLNTKTHYLMRIFEPELLEAGTLRVNHSMTYKSVTLPAEYDWDFAFRKAFRDPTTERHQRLVAEAVSRYSEAPVG